MPKVELSNAQCQMLSLAMGEAAAQCDEEIGRICRTASPADLAEARAIRAQFADIKTKMDYAQVGEELVH